MAVASGIIRTAVAFCALLLTAFEASAERRVALVIGNAAYQHTTRLNNPRNDAEDVAATLKRLQFDTIVGFDLTKSQMDSAVIRFARAARDSDVAFFYYSGHAMQFASANYLLPVDAKLGDEEDLRLMTKVDEILGDLQKAKNLRILVLDSCRDNPLADELKRSVGLTRGAAVGRGLARMDGPQGTIISYATQSNRTADDGSGRNSPYTAAFLKHIETREEIGTLFRRIGAEVANATRQSQLPELSLSLFGEIYLNGRPSVAGAPAPAAAPAPSNEAERAWSAAKDSTNPAVLEAFIRRFGDTFYGDMARVRLDELKKQAAAASPQRPQQQAALPQASAPAPAAAAPQSGPVFSAGGALGPKSALPAVPPQGGFPNKPIKIVVPFPAGGASDVVARAVGEVMSKSLRQPIVVENIGGGGGTTGSAQVAKAAADGYTILLANDATLTFSQLIHPMRVYDSLTDFAPIGLIGASPIVVAAKKDMPSDAGAFLRRLKEGAKLSYASGGTGTSSHLACARFVALASGSSTHVPYRGFGPAIADLAGGHVDFLCVAPTAILPQIQSGSVKAILTTSTERLPSLSGVPTAREAGLPNFQVSNWYGLFAPKGVPLSALQALNYALAHSLEDGTLKSRLSTMLGLIPTTSHRTPEALASLLRTDIETWGPVVKAAGVAIQ